MMIIYIMKNFLVTGALGFIGSNFINYMADKYKDYYFVILDKKDYCASLLNINKDIRNVHIMIGNINNIELVNYALEHFNIDTIVHFAASTHVDNSFYNSVSFTEINVLGTHILLECVKIYNDRTNKIEKFIHVSTDEVYGEVIDNELRYEYSILDPTNPYAASKAAAEFLIKSYYYSYKLPIIITRGNNVYGINQYPEKVIPKFICQLLNNQKITIQGTGENKRNFIHVNDVVDAFEIILFNGNIGEIYNIGSDINNEFTINYVGETLIKLIKGDVNVKDYIEYIEDRKFNDFRYFISSEKLEKLGWKPKNTNFVKQLDELIVWYKENKNRFKDNKIENKL